MPSPSFQSEQRPYYRPRSLLSIASPLLHIRLVDEALTYINQSLGYNPANIYSQYVKAYILYAKNGNLQQTKERLMRVLNQDTTRLDVLQETGKICYYMGDYQEAYKYYKAFLDIRESQHLDLYRYENAKIGYVMEKMGYHEKAGAYFSDFKAYYENDQSIYRPISLAMYHAHKGNTQQALEYLKEFSQQENYHYWVILFFQQDPLVEKIKDHPEFKPTFEKIQASFWNKHEQIRKTLEKKQLL